MLSDLSAGDGIFLERFSDQKESGLRTGGKTRIRNPQSSIGYRTYTG